MSQAWWADKRACDVCGRKNQYLKSYEGVSSKCFKKCRRSQGVAMTRIFFGVLFAGSDFASPTRVAWKMHMLLQVATCVTHEC